MKTLPVVVPSTKRLIQPSPGFAKKGLADYHLELMALCGFSCAYCSSNEGNYLRMNRERFANEAMGQAMGFAADESDADRQALAKDILEAADARANRGDDGRILPANEPRLTLEWALIIDKLHVETRARSSGLNDFGARKTLVFSMLTDGFSPRALASGFTKRALELLVERTALRIRILTKSCTVGKSEWIEFFLRHRDRFVVGLSIGSMDDEWAAKVELGTSKPSARLKALRALQDAGVPTYGMLCPVFPDVLTKYAAQSGGLDDLVAQIRPERCEHVWAEPYNDRANWRAVQAGYERGTREHGWFAEAFEYGDRGPWSHYATELYARLKMIAERDGWLSKLRYLLYEHGITGNDATWFRGLQGVLLQSKPGDNGRSRNPAIAALQGVPTA